MPLGEPPVSFPDEGWVAKLWHEQEAFDEIVHRHSIRVSIVCAVLAREMGWSEPEIVKMQIAGQFHDIGKLDIPREILNAPRRLTPEERELIEGHSIFGGRRIRSLGQTPVLGFVEEVVLHHHERFDGTGYPDKQQGKGISEQARIAMVGDVYSALWEKRSYKDAMSHDEVATRMSNGDERMTPAMFDPDILAALRDALPAIKGTLTA
ncbi:MAG: HD domain-containing protein [Alphaproteobacteria bacterium]|nr:HD domain-containing protein [Alphaproteobacteria bacterium]